MTAFEIDSDEWSNVLSSVKIDEFYRKTVCSRKSWKVSIDSVCFLDRVYAVKRWGINHYRYSISAGFSKENPIFGCMTYYITTERKSR